MNGLTNIIGKLINICCDVHNRSALYKMIETLRYYRNIGCHKIRDSLNKDTLGRKISEKIEKSIKNAIRKNAIIKIHKKVIFCLNSILGILIYKYAAFKANIGFIYKIKKKNIKERINEKGIIDIKPYETAINDQQKIKHRKKRRKTLSILLKRSEAKSRRSKKKMFRVNESKNGLIDHLVFILSVGENLK